jgi:hypothetical protein
MKRSDKPSGMTTTGKTREAVIVFLKLSSSDGSATQIKPLRRFEERETPIPSSRRAI